jgi:hypothetical protein
MLATNRCINSCSCSVCAAAGRINPVTVITALRRHPPDLRSGRHYCRLLVHRLLWLAMRELSCKDLTSMRICHVKRLKFLQLLPQQRLLGGLHQGFGNHSSGIVVSAIPPACAFSSSSLCDAASMKVFKAHQGMCMPICAQQQ